MCGLLLIGEQRLLEDREKAIKIEAKLQKEYDELRVRENVAGYEEIKVC